MVVARWEGALDLERARAVLASGSEVLAEEPEAVADALSEGVPLASELAVAEPGSEKGTSSISSV